MTEITTTKALSEVNRLHALRAYGLHKVAPAPMAKELPADLVRGCQGLAAATDAVISVTVRITLPLDLVRRLARAWGGGR